MVFALGRISGSTRTRNIESAVVRSEKKSGAFGDLETRPVALIDVRTVNGEGVSTSCLLGVRRERGQHDHSAGDDHDSEDTPHGSRARGYWCFTDPGHDLVRRFTGCDFVARDAAIDSSVTTRTACLTTRGSCVEKMKVM